MEAREQAEKARAQADQALQQVEKARREAEAREKDARAPAVDPGRLEAEIRAARLEAQLQVMKAAYDDLRQETNRLRKSSTMSGRAISNAAPAWTREWNNGSTSYKPTS